MAEDYGIDLIEHAERAYARDRITLSGLTATAEPATQGG